MQTQPIPLDYGWPGCRRDGTRFDGNFLTDCQWNRSKYGRNSSMGGYRRVVNTLPEISRGLNVFDSAGFVYISVGMASYLYQNTINQFGNVVASADRTPAAFVADAQNLWQFDYIYDTGSSTVRVIAHAAQNLDDISSTTAADVWYGDATAATPLISTGSVVSGGCVCLQPYLFTFGTAGVLNWSVPNKPNDFTNTGSGTARIGAMKIVAGMPIRAGAGNAPSGLFWALDSLIRASFVGGTTIFQFDTFSNEASILSAQSVVEYDGIYYWIGIDRFMSFNGVIREVPNDMNLDWFFDNLNYTQRQKVFGFKIPRYGEIWWCYPRGNATECTHAVILNLRERRPDGSPVWYDTALPDNGRTCAHQSQVFAWPLAGGVDADAASGEFKIWQHEFGNDAIDGVSITAIQKSFTTAEMSLVAPSGGAGTDASMVLDALEPDFFQEGSLSVQTIGRANARAPDQNGTPQTIIAQTDGVGVDPQDQLVFFPQTERNQRLVRFHFESNVQGGSYFAGKSILHIGKGDGRRRS